MVPGSVNMQLPDMLLFGSYTYIFTLRIQFLSPHLIIDRFDHLIPRIIITQLVTGLITILLLLFRTNKLAILQLRGQIGRRCHNITLLGI